ncbi:MAG: AAA-like domain-containing protein [Ardenticatenaceae bacterium]
MSIAPRRRDFFVAGGALSAKAPSYVEREADEELFGLTQAGKFSYVLTPRQMGKTSLMHRTAQRLKQEENVRTARIDLTGLGTASVAEWYLALLAELTRQLRLSVDLTAWWQTHAGLGPVTRFTNFVRDVLLTEMEADVVIFIDEIDFTLRLDFSDDFFAAIRAFYNARPQEPSFERLTFVLLGVATPPDLIKERTRTPFNIGEGLILPDFSLAEAEVLQYGLEEICPSQGAVIFGQIYQWTDGHPYLTQKLCQAVVEAKQARWSKEQIDELVERSFFSEQGRKEDNLQFVQSRIVTHPQQRDLLGLYKKVYNRQKIQDNPQSILQNQLKLSGLVKTEEGCLQVRNNIYRQVFDLAWVKTHTAIDWTRIIAVSAVFFMLFFFGLLAQSTWAGTHANYLASHIYPSTSPTEQVALLAELFRLQAYVPQTDYDYRAKEAFYGLPRERQSTLFNGYHGPEEDLIEVVKGLYTTFADLNQDNGTSPVLEAMRDALGRVEDSEKSAQLESEISFWLEGRRLFQSASYNEALTEYDQAIDLNETNPNPATRYERARVRSKLGQYEAALTDLDRVIGIAEDLQPADATPTVIVTATAPEVTPTSRSTPTSGSTPILTNTPSNEPFTPSPLPTTNGTGVVMPTAQPTATTPAPPTATPTPVPAILTAQFDTREKMISAVRIFILQERSLLQALANATDTEYQNLQNISLPPPVALEGTPFPQPVSAISAANAQQVRQLARWGKGRISEIAISPDGQVLAVASSVGIYLYDAQTLEEVNYIESDAYARSVAFSPDGKTLASASFDQTVRLWSTDGTLIRALSGHTSDVSRVAFSPDGSFVASASDDGTVRLWSTSGMLLRTLSGHTGSVWSVAFSPDGSLMASASSDQTVRLWSTEGALLNTLSGHTSDVWSVAFSPDGKTLASASSDQTVRLWSTSGTRLSTLEGHTDYVWSVAFSPDGNRLASASLDNTVRLWSTDGTRLTTLKAHTDSVRSVAFSPDGKTLTSASLDGTVRLWSTGGTLLNTLEGHTSLVWSLGFSLDGSFVVSASDDNTVRLWSTDGTPLQTLLGDTDRMMSVAFSPNGSFVASASSDNTVRLWSTDGTLLNTLSGHTSFVESMAFSPDGKTLASASSDQTVRLWSTDGTLLTSLEGHTDWVRSVAFSPDGTRLASASSDQTVRLWSTDGTLLNTFSGHTSPVLSVVFSPDGNRLASASFDQTVRLWSTDGTLLQTLAGHTNSVLSVAFSPDGSLVASASSDETVRLWSTDGTPLQSLKGNTLSVTSVAFSPDGTLLASGSWGGTVRLWGVPP